MPDTRRAGIYRLVVGRRAARHSAETSYAANPDPRESALERIEAPELKSFLSPLEVEIIRARNNEGEPVLVDRPRDLA